MLNRRGESGHTCLVPDISRIALKISSLTMVLCVCKVPTVNSKIQLGLKYGYIPKLQIANQVGAEWMSPLTIDGKCRKC